MTTQNRTKIVLTLAAAAAATLALSANRASAALVVNPALSPGDVVALYPLNDGPSGSPVSIADDFIDDPTHGATDGTPNIANSDQWIFDGVRNRVVLDTTDLVSYSAGTQDIDLNNGFSWSLWVNVASSNTGDPAADGIIGTRNGGTWHKIDIGGGPFSGVTNWSDISGNLYSLADDTWHHLALVGDTTDVSFYIDGAIIGSDPTQPTPTFNGAFEFGGVSRFGERVTGRYSEIGVWETRLSLAQIQALAGGEPLLVDDAANAIPEPSTFALSALGLLSLGCVGWRRRRR